MLRLAKDWNTPAVRAALKGARKRTQRTVGNIIKKPIDGLANYHVKFILNAL